MKISASLLTALLLVSAASASNCSVLATKFVTSQYVAPVATTVTHNAYSANTYNQGYVAPIIATYQIPAYGAIYIPPYNPPAANGSTAQQSHSSDTKLILEAIGGVKTDVSELRKRVEVLEAAKGAVQPPKAKEPDKQKDPLGPDPFSPNKTSANAPLTARTVAMAIYTAKCVQCHSEKTASEEGGNFVLVRNGQKADLTDKQASRMITKTQARKMPPEKNSHGIQQLTDDEYAVVVLDNTR